METRLNRCRNIRLCIAMMGLAMIILALCSCAGSCSLAGPALRSDRFTVTTYNVQNLFDSITDGTEYQEFTPGGGWTGSCYPLRLERTAQAIVQGMPMLPDVVVLQEIEHERVVEDLVSRHLAKRGFAWFATTADPAAPIQVGIISRHPIEAAFVHGVGGGRSVLEARVMTPHGIVVVFGLHAKSQREGESETEQQRIATTRTVGQASLAVRSALPGVPLIVAGDFNESADISLRNTHGGQTALVVPQASNAAIHAANGSLMITGSVPGAQQWHCWWLDRQALFDAQSQGSYRYGGVWETFDQVLVSPECFDSTGWEFERGQVHADPQLCTSEGYPSAWDDKKSTGYSDHLPVYVVLQWK